VEPVVVAGGFSVTGSYGGVVWMVRGLSPRVGTDGMPEYHLFPFGWDLYHSSYNDGEDSCTSSEYCWGMRTEQLLLCFGPCHIWRRIGILSGGL
jgi:hypothetical protein